MKIDRIKSVEHRFTESEYAAILSALPLVSQQAPVVPEMRKAQADAIAKINRRSIKFQNHEFRAIISAVELSVQLLSGKCPELMQKIQQDQEWLAEMKLHFFVLNSLRGQFHSLLQETD